MTATAIARIMRIDDQTVGSRRHRGAEGLTNARKTYQGHESLARAGAHGGE
jgi:hypothetical protein